MSVVTNVHTEISTYFDVLDRRGARLLFRRESRLEAIFCFSKICRTGLPYPPDGDGEGVFSAPFFTLLRAIRKKDVYLHFIIDT